MSTLSPAREAIRTWLLEQEGKPYVYGHKGPMEFDCSGLVTSALLIGGHPRACGTCGLGMRMFHSASKLWAELEPVDMPGHLDLVFYGRPRGVSHVVFYWGDGRTYGANGGDSKTTNVDLARELGAKVCFRPSVTYRTDLRGFRTLPVI